MLSLLFLSTFICPSQDLIDVKLTHWGKETSQIKELEPIKRHLKKVGVTLKLGGEGKLFYRRHSIRSLRMDDSLSNHTLLELSYIQDGDGDPHMETEETHILVLRQLDTDRYCKVGHIKSERGRYEVPCDAPPPWSEVSGRDKPPLIVEPVNLLHAQHKVLKVTQYKGSCFGDPRSSDISAAYYGLINGQLSKLFETDLYQSRYSGQDEPVTQEITVKLTGGYPKIVKLKTVNSCLYQESRERLLIPKETEEHVECIDYQFRSWFAFAGKSYQPISKLVERDEDKAKLISDLAYRLLEKKHPTRSIELSKVALSLSSSLELRGTIFYHLGLAAEAINQLDQAKQYYQLSLREKSDHPQAKGRLDQVLIQLKQ